MAATIENPESLAQWWSYIQTDSTPLKVRYFFRNQSAIRSACIVDSRWTTLEEMLAFLGEQVALKCHRQYDYAPCGVYSMRERDGETEQFEATFRIDPSTPSARGPLHGVPSICLCSFSVLSNGKWVSVL